MSKHVGSSIRVFWANDNEWFHGVIDDYHPDQGWHCQYFDGDEEWLTDIHDKDLVQFENDKGDLGNTDHLNETKEDELLEDEDELLLMKEKKSPVNGSLQSNNVVNISSDNGDDEIDIQAKETVAAIEPYDEREDDDLYELEAAALAITHNTHTQRTPDEDENNVDVEDGGGDNVQRVGAVVLDKELLEDPNDPNVAFDLPERGVIMMGHVTNASNLPQPAGGETDGRVFFRILYVEGSTKSTMFRCKTPVYTSKEANDLIFPEWNDAEFRFEMVMPVIAASKAAKVSDVVSTAAGLPSDSKAGKRRPSASRGGTRKVASTRQDVRVDGKNETESEPEPFMIQGEILVALYRARAQGGSDFIGQVSFDLAQMAVGGTTRYPSDNMANVGVQVRSTQGSYPIVTRSGAIAGDGMAHVDVAFELVWRPDSSSSVEAKTLETEEKLTLKAKTPLQPKKSVPLTKEKEKPKFKTFNAKRKLMEAHRIEKENKTLAAALRKHATKGQNKYRSVDKAEDVYAIPRESLISGKDPPKPRSSDEEELYQFTRKVSKMSHDELMTQYVNLKKEVAQQKVENATKNATVSRLKLHAKKYGLANERMKRKIDVSGGHLAKGQPYASEAMKDIAIAAKQQRDINSELAKEGENLDGDGIVIPDEASVTREALEGEGSTGDMGYAQYLSIIDNENFSNVDDPELKEHLQEHIGLQQARAHLVGRIQAAKKACQQSMESLDDAKNREKVARARLGSAFSKLGNKYAGQGSASGTKASEEDRRMEEDLQAIERVRGVTLELARTEAMHASGINIGPIKDSTEELLGMESRLTSIMTHVRNDVAQWKEKKADVLVQMSALQEERVSSMLRQRLGQMREKLLNVCRQQKVMKFSAGVDGIELEALRLQLRRQQKDMSLEG